MGRIPYWGIASLQCRASHPEALLQAPVGVGRFVIRATHERGVGLPSSRSLATASREANPVYGRCLPMGCCASLRMTMIASLGLTTIGCENGPARRDERGRGGRGDGVPVGLMRS